MNQRLFLLFCALFGLSAAIFVGIAIGEGNYAILLMAFGGLILFLLLFVFFPSVLPEAKILTFLVFGYVVFQRYFAELRVARFIFIGEIGLGLAAALLLGRLAFQRSRAIPPHPLTAPIVLMLALGTARFVMFDFKQFGLVAARDFALVYYMGFYFIGYGVGQHVTSRRLLLKTFYWSSALYLVMALVLAPLSQLGGLLTIPAFVLTTRDMAVIVPAYATLLLGIAAVKYHRPVLFLVSLIPLAWLLYLRARSGYVAFGVGATVFLAAISVDRATFILRILMLAFGTALVGSILLVGSTLARVETIQPFVTEVVDIFDVEAFQERKSASHRGEGLGYSQQTSRWRTAWWQSIYEETLQKNPLFGVGFGYDLARRFNREYYGRSGGEASARNPHNVAFTFLGRMGFVGLALFVWFCTTFFRQMWQVVSAVRRRRQPLGNVNLWLVNLVMLVVGLFSHTFEGPMAAIPFWSFLGIAVAQQLAVVTSRPERTEAPVPQEVLAPA